MKIMLIVFRKGRCGFFLVSGFTLEEKLCGVICHKFQGPEGVLEYVGMHEGFSFTPSPILIEIGLVLIELCNKNSFRHVPIC